VKDSVGICTHYRRHEATYHAIQVASWASLKGLDVSMVGMLGPPKTRVGSEWDDKVVHIDRRSPPFTEWAKRHSSIVWTYTPHHSQIEICSALGVRSIVIPLWHELADCDIYPLMRCTAVIAATDTQACFFSRRLNLANVRHAPWDTGQPLLAKRRPINCVIGLPLFDGMSRRTEMTVFEVLDRTLAAFGWVKFRIAVSATVVANFVKRRMFALQAKFPGRVSVDRSPDYDVRPTWLAACDLCLWPVCAENNGMIPLTSRMSGTPVVAFDIAPLSDVVPLGSGRLVKTPVSYEELCLPVAQPDYSALEGALWSIIESPNAIREMQAHVQFDAADRAAAFNQVMSEVLG